MRFKLAAAKPAVLVPLDPFGALDLRYGEDPPLSQRAVAVVDDPQPVERGAPLAGVAEAQCELQGQVEVGLAVALRVRVALFNRVQLVD